MVMMRRLLSILVILFFCMLSPNIVKGQSDGAVISISATAYAPGMIGHGITIHIANIESGQVFISKSLHGISNNSVIENVPAGKYAVTFAEIPFGNIKWRNRSPELKNFFGIIQVDSGESYYLGTFEATFEGSLKDRRVMFYYRDNIIPEKLIKYFNKHNLPTEDIKCLEPAGESFIFAHASL